MGKIIPKPGRRVGPEKPNQSFDVEVLRWYDLTVKRE